MPTTIPSWDPSHTLEIGDITDGCTCVGYAPSKGRRCRNPIAAVNRQAASKILSRLSRMDVMSANLEPLLMELALLLLCRRWHQNQVETVTKNWLPRVYKPQNHRVARTESEMDATMGTLPRVVRRYAEEQQVPRPRAAATTYPDQQPVSTSRAVAPSRPTPASETAQSPAPSRTQHHRSVAPGPASTQVEQSLAATGHPIENDQRAREANRHIPDDNDIPPRSTSPLTPSVPATSATESQMEQNIDHATTVAVEEENECSICYEEVTDGSSVISCRTQCRHKFHIGCLSEWFSVLGAREQPLICPYW